jgi:hypothetical protein
MSPMPQPSLWQEFLMILQNIVPISIG